MSFAQFVQVVVGGLPYSIAVSDIEKFPGSFFECMIKKEWMNSKKNKPIAIERDGALFKYVNSFLVTDCLPRDKHGQISLDDDTLEGLKQEADFFGLDALKDECQIECKKKEELDVHSFMTIRKYLERLDDSCSYGTNGQSGIEIEYSSKLIQSLKAAASPFCLTGELSEFESKNIFKNSTIDDLKIDELITCATQSPFGRGTKTVTDKTVRNSFEIPASRLKSPALRQISQDIKLTGFAPHLELELRPYKLVIYQEGGHFDAHRDTVRGEGHIGTVVVILNSEYTGGELEVSHNKQTVAVTGAYKWVAMYGDCLHKINPVTSGTRVSLIYDIYGSAEDADEEGSDEGEEENYDEDDEEERQFWEEQNSGRPAAPSLQICGINKTKHSAIKTAVDSELASFDALIITLQHLYPECQTSPAFLKGGDRALYDLLSEQFDVQVVAATILRSHMEESDDYDFTSCELFSPAIVKKVLESERWATPAKKQRVGRTKLVITSKFDAAGLLDYTPYIDYTGNESQAEKTVYIVAGLQVTKRAV